MTNGGRKFEVSNFFFNTIEIRTSSFFLRLLKTCKELKIHTNKAASIDDSTLDYHITQQLLAFARHIDVFQRKTKLLMRITILRQSGVGEAYLLIK